MKSGELRSYYQSKYNLVKQKNAELRGKIIDLEEEVASLNSKLDDMKDKVNRQVEVIEFPPRITQLSKKMPPPRHREEIVLQQCSLHGDITINQLKSKSRKGEIVKARQIAQWILYNVIGGYSLNKVATITGSKDHSVVSTSCKRVRDIRDVDNRYRTDTDLIANKCLKLIDEYEKTQGREN